MIIKIATMVKDEDDIVEEWIKYHGKIFGYNNLFIIDNCSTDNTYNICQKFVEKGLNLEVRDNYSKKGDYMTEIKNKNKCDFFIPLDIDEFIVYYNSKIDFDLINHFKNLNLSEPAQNIFKMNYIMPLRTNNNLPIIKQFTHGVISDYGMLAKTFIRNSSSNNIIFDHGNHYFVKDYKLSNFYLIHYHKRSNIQYKKKIINNVLGLNYKVNILYLKLLLQKNKHCNGEHHVRNCIEILENPGKDNSPKLLSIDSVKHHIDIQEISNYI
jgi:hypothetical protein